MLEKLIQRAKEVLEAKYIDEQDIRKNLKQWEEKVREIGEEEVFDNIFSYQYRIVKELEELYDEVKGCPEWVKEQIKEKNKKERVSSSEKSFLLG